MARLRLDRRAAILLAFPGLILAGFVAERTLLAARVAARSPADEVRYWEEHVARSGGYAASQVRLGLAYQAVARLDDAQRAYETALAMDPDQESAAIGRYGILERKRERDAALAGLEAYARDHPRCAVCWHNLAAAYLERGRLDAAAAAAESLLASGLTVTSGMYSATNLHFEAFLMAGRVYAARGDHPRAIGLLRDAIAREPGDVRGHLNLARSLLASGDVDAASAALDDAQARLAPDDAARRGEIARLREQAQRGRAGG
jgi:tetratricopeptide (TPR) repeat protein